MHTVISVIYRDIDNAVGFAEVHLQPCSCLINISVGTIGETRVCISIIRSACRIRLIG